MTEKQMTKGEREDLIRLVKQRERVAKAAAEQRSAALLAEFEHQISALHDFNKNEVWSAAVAAGIAAAKEANRKIDEEAAALGIPEEFRPKLNITWDRRGENEYSQRRDELRRAAKAEIAAIEKTARVQIEAASVQAQSEIIATGLTSAAAITFLENMPKVETLMPLLDAASVQAKLADKSKERGRYYSHSIDLEGDD